MTRRGILTFVAVLLLLARGGAAGLRWRSLDEVSYETAVIARGDVEATVAAVGTVRARHAVEVGAQVSGQIVKLHVQASDSVEKGRLLVEIDASVHQATVDAGRAAIERLRAQVAEEEAQVKLAEQQLARLESLNRDRLTAEEDLQEAQARRDSTAARLLQRRAEITERESTLKGEEALLGYTRIYAPMSGTVISVDAREGQTLNATYQTPTVLRLADLKLMTVWTAVADIHRVKAGMPASFNTLGNDDRRWSGAVRQILPTPPIPPGEEAPRPEFGRVVQYTVLFDVENADGFLLPQMTAQVSVLTDQVRDVVRAPLAGLAAVEGQRDVFHACVLGDDGRPEGRTVRTGKRNRRVAEVLEGLREGERLVLAERQPERQRRFAW